MLIPLGMLQQQENIKFRVASDLNYKWPEENGFPTVLYDILLDGWFFNCLVPKKLI